MATRDSLIQVTDLKKYYNKGAIKALDGVTVDINRGDVMVVIGPSGSGKSTFLRSHDPGLFEAEPLPARRHCPGIELRRVSGGDHPGRYPVH